MPTRFWSVLTQFGAEDTLPMFAADAGALYNGEDPPAVSGYSS
ncbi:MAG: hypothetical protein U5L04_05990 [Trueperaceae bacterium]|nr:hypothetical protein [Trueperaceae bacterium]